MVAGVGEVGIQIYGPAQVLHRPVAFAHRHVGQSPVVVSVGVAGGQGDGHVEVAHRPRKVAQLRLARPPAVVRHGVAWGQADGGVVVLHRQAVLLQLGVGAGPVEVGARIVGFEGDDPAVVLRRKAVLPQLAVCQPPGGQGLGVAGVRLDSLRQMLDHPAKALATPRCPSSCGTSRYSSSDGFPWSIPSCSSFMTFLLYVLAFSYRAGPSLRGRRPRMAQAAACGPDSNRSPPAELRVGPSPRGLFLGPLRDCRQ